MKAKASRSSRKKVRPKTGPVKEDGAKSLPRNPVIFARLYENSQGKAGWLFTLTAKLVKFYVDKVEPRMKSARARLTQFKLWVTGPVDHRQSQTGRSQTANRRMAGQTQTQSVGNGHCGHCSGGHCHSGLPVAALARLPHDSQNHRRVFLLK